MDVIVRFKERDATVRYLPRKVGLDQILKRYDDTPFDVSPTGPVVSVAHTERLTLRGWSKRPLPPAPTGTGPDKKAVGPESELVAIEVIVELIPGKAVQIGSKPQLSVSDPEAVGLELRHEFEEVLAAAKPTVVETDPSRSRSDARRFVARLTETVALQPGEVIVPIRLRIPTVDADKTQHTVEAALEVVVHTLPRAQQTVAEPTTGVVWIDGTLELRLGHLCDQKGCVEHFHKSLVEIPGLGAVRPHPSLKDPRADVYLRVGQRIDVWTLCERLRDQGVEATGIVARGLTSYRLRVELPRWQVDEKSREVLQCLVCRDRTARVVQELPWVEQLEVAGGGINFRPTRPDVDLVELLDALTNSEIAPLALWLLPAGVPMPKVTPPQLADRKTDQKQGGSNVHPVVEFHFGHTCDVGTSALAVLGRRAWQSRTHAELARETMIVRAAIGDRKYANLTPLLREWRSVGHIPQRMRLTGFGDFRVHLEFAHICGEVEYSKPKKKAKKKEAENKEAENKEAENKEAADSKKDANSGDDCKKPQPKTKSQHNHGGESAESKKQQIDSKQTSSSDDSKDKPEKKPKPKKPFVPKPLRPAKSSNGRQAIEAAVARVGWIQQATFNDYHTRPEFTGPRKLTLAGQVDGDDVVEIDELIRVLGEAGFPPKSVIVSRRFPGIPFGKQLPGDLLVTDRQGKRFSLSSRRKPGQPLALAFVSLKCPRHKKYQADPKLYKHLARIIDKYRDRVQFVAVAANPDDRFADVVEFWEKTGLQVPLLSDADGEVRSVFNSQVTPPPHMFVFDADERLRYAGEPHDHWEETEKEVDDFLARALDLVLAGTYEANGAVFFNKSLCNCSDPNCKCPKCGCGATCRCTIKH